MAHLADALRQSPLAAAYMDTPDSARVLVTRTLAQPLFEASTLDEVMARLRTLNRPGFIPEADAWMPTTADTAVRSSEWSVDVPSRGLSAEDSAEGRHANDSDTLPPVE